MENPYQSKHENLKSHFSTFHVLSLNSEKRRKSYLGFFFFFSLSHFVFFSFSFCLFPLVTGKTTWERCREKIVSICQTVSSCPLHIHIFLFLSPFFPFLPSPSQIATSKIFSITVAIIVVIQLSIAIAETYFPCEYEVSSPLPSLFLSSPSPSPISDGSLLVQFFPFIFGLDLYFICV